MKPFLRENKNAIIGGVLAFFLIWLGVVASAKHPERIFEKNRFRVDKKYSYQMAKYLVRHKLPGTYEFCRSAPLGHNRYGQSATKCTTDQLGPPDKVAGNKYLYELLNDEIIIWRMYLVIEFDLQKDEVISADIYHFDPLPDNPS